MYESIADNAVRNINWYFRLSPSQLASVARELQNNLATLQDVLRAAKQYNPEFAKKYQEDFDNFRMAYTSVAKE